MYPSIYSSLPLPLSVVLQVSPFLHLWYRHDSTICVRRGLSNGRFPVGSQFSSLIPVFSTYVLSISHFSLKFLFVTLECWNKSWSFRLCLILHYPVSEFWSWSENSSWNFLFGNFRPYFLHFSEPYNTAGRIDVMYIWTLKFWNIAFVLSSSPEAAIIISKPSVNLSTFMAVYWIGVAPKYSKTEYSPWSCGFPLSLFHRVDNRPLSHCRFCSVIGPKRNKNNKHYFCSRHTAIAVTNARTCAVPPR